MPQDVAKSGPPGGRRVGRAEVELRLAATEQMLRDGHTRTRVVAALARNFGASERTADDYIARVRARWLADAAGARRTERERAVERLRKLSRKAEAKGAFNAAINAERLLIDMLGVRVDDPRAVAAEVPEEEELTREQAAEELARVIPSIAGCIRAGFLKATPWLTAAVDEIVRALAASSTPGSPSAEADSGEKPPV